MWKRTLLFAAAGGPLVAWLWYLEIALRGSSADSGFSYGQVGSILSTPSYRLPEILAWTLHILDVLLLAGVLLAVFLAVRYVIRSPRSAEAISCALYAPLAVAVAVIVSTWDPYSLPRLVSPMLVLLALQGMKAGTWTNLLPMLALSARPAAQLGTQVLGIWRGLLGG